MSASKYRHRVTIQRKEAPVLDPRFGLNPGEWVDIPAKVNIWAFVEPIMALERLLDQSIKNEAAMFVWIRYSNGFDLLPTDRVVYNDPRAGTQVLDILGIVDVENRHIEIRIDTKQNLG